MEISHCASVWTCTRTFCTNNGRTGARGWCAENGCWWFWIKRMSFNRKLVTSTVILVNGRLVEERKARCGKKPVRFSWWTWAVPGRRTHLCVAWTGPDSKSGSDSTTVTFNPWAEQHLLHKWSFFSGKPEDLPSRKLRVAVSLHRSLVLLLSQHWMSKKHEHPTTCEYCKIANCKKKANESPLNETNGSWLQGNNWQRHFESALLQNTCTGAGVVMGTFHLSQAPEMGENCWFKCPIKSVRTPLAWKAHQLMITVYTSRLCGFWDLFKNTHLQNKRHIFVSSNTIFHIWQTSKTIDLLCSQIWLCDILNHHDAFVPTKRLVFACMENRIARDFFSGTQNMFTFETPNENSWIDSKNQRNTSTCVKISQWRHPQSFCHCNIDHMASPQWPASLLHRRNNWLLATSAQIFEQRRHSDRTSGALCVLLLFIFEAVSSAVQITEFQFRSVSFERVLHSLWEWKWLSSCNARISVFVYILSTSPVEKLQPDSSRLGVGEMNYSSWTTTRLRGLRTRTCTSDIVSPVKLCDEAFACNSSMSWSLVD